MLEVRGQTMIEHIVMIPRNDHLLSLHNIVSTVIQRTGLSIPQLSLVGSKNPLNTKHHYVNTVHSSKTREGPTASAQTLLA